MPDPRQQKFHSPVARRRRRVRTGTAPRHAVDRAEITRALDVLFAPGDVTELRSPECRGSHHTSDRTP